MKIITTILDELEFGSPASFRNLSVFPLIRRNNADADYLTLDEALAAGTARVTEVSPGGSVPELKFVNDGERPVLLLDGEELTGAKQNRVLNLTILAPGKQTIIIPVSCVEAGRWANHGNGFFDASPRVMYQSARGKKAAQVSHAMHQSGHRRSDQSAVWDDLAVMSEALGASSPTGEMAEIYRQHEATIEDYVRAIPPVADQIGGVFAIDGRIRGLELLDRAGTMHKLLPKLVRSYALDAIGSRVDLRQQVPTQSAKEFIAEVGSADARTMKAIGLGEDVRLSAPALAGGALVHDGRVVHLSAFRLDAPGDDGGGRRSSMASLGQRMRRRHRGN